MDMLKFIEKTLFIPIAAMNFLHQKLKYNRPTSHVITSNMFYMVVLLKQWLDLSVTKHSHSHFC